MRGQKLYQSLSLFPDAAREQDDAAEWKPGRDSELVRKRNLRLCARLHYYRNYSKLNYEEVLERLVMEFEISKVYIPQILEKDDMQTELQRLKNLKPSLKYFDEQWDWMVWKALK